MSATKSCNRLTDGDMDVIRRWARIGGDTLLMEMAPRIEAEIDALRAEVARLHQMPRPRRSRPPMTEDVFPPHKAALYLSHNEHRSYYETVEQWASRAEPGGEPDWVSPEQRAKAIATDSVWDLQWYPETPIGFCRLLACDLGVLLEAAREGGMKP